MRIYTRHGDDGTTALRDGKRLRKDALVIELNGAIDEAQAALGCAPRAETTPGGELDAVLISIERDLWVVMADIADPRDTPSAPEMHVRQDMVVALEESIDSYLDRFEVPRNFSVPGDNRLSAALDYARTVVRRAERLAVADDRTGLVVSYLNRLSDLCWALARFSEDQHLLNKRDAVRPLRAEPEAD